MLEAEICRLYEFDCPPLKKLYVTNAPRVVVYASPGTIAASAVYNLAAAWLAEGKGQFGGRDSTAAAVDAVVVRWCYESDHWR